MQQSELSAESKDIAAFVGISLLEIHRTIDITVGPWEKRGYWVKADKFRLEWEWTEGCACDIHKALSKNNWGEIAKQFALIGNHLSNVKPPVRNKSISYGGCWDRLCNIISSQE